MSNNNKINEEQRKDKEVIDMKTMVERYCPITESLEESLKQMNLIRQGKLKGKSWNEFKKELQEEDKNQ